VIELFGKDTLTSLIVPAVRSTFRSGDVGGYGQVFLQELGIEDEFRNKRPRANVVVNEAVRQLSCGSLAGREAARDSITALLLSPHLIERDAGKIIGALIDSWRKDLRQALESAFSPDHVAERGSQFTVQVDKRASAASCRKVESILVKEEEHAQWILRLLASRSVDFRGELEAAEGQLTAFHAQRAATSIKFVVTPSAQETTLFKLQHISINDDRALLEELRQRTSLYEELLSRENYPAILSDVVGRQLFVPAATADAMESLCQLTLPLADLSLSSRELKDGSPEEYLESRKADAIAFMQSVAVEAAVFKVRVNFARQRCAPLENLPLVKLPRQVEVAERGEALRDEVVKIVRDSKIEERIVSTFLSQLNAYFIAEPEPESSVICFSVFIPASDTMGERARMILVAAEVESESAEWVGDTAQDPATSGEDIFEPGVPQGGKVAIEDGSSETEAWSHGGGEQLDDYGDFPDDWLESSIVVLEERNGRELLNDGGLLVRWLSGFQDLLRRSHKANSRAKVSEDEAGDDDADTVALEGDARLTWRYHGLSQDEVEAAFRSTFSTSKGSGSEHHRSFFDIIAQRYEVVWYLLPTDSRLHPTIPPIEELSPIEAAISVLSILETHSQKIESLSHEQKANVMAWLQSYQETYESGKITIDQH
jgi:hypothetical protein